MKIENINLYELLHCATKDMNIIEKDIPWGDYYRRYFTCPSDSDVLGFFYKKFLDVSDTKEIKERIEQNKDFWNNCTDRPWEYHLVAKLFTLINRVTLAQRDLVKAGACKFEDPVISGIALYENYPVGVYFPKKLLNYKSLAELQEEDLTNEEKNMIFSKVELWILSLMEHDVYAEGLYYGNILVNPNDYSDVILDGLDGPDVCRVENMNYVNELILNFFYLFFHLIFSSFLAFLLSLIFKLKKLKKKIM